jgi:GNAT superfamily N-acetyltransferase
LNGPVEIRVVAYDHPHSVALIDELQQEYVVRYGGQDGTPVDPSEFAPPLGLFLVGYRAGVPVACGGWRAHGNGVVEIKRMYVVSPARGQGLARAMLAELELTAKRAGHRRIVLETGQKQPEALALYRSSGFTEVPRFGYYAEAELAVHLGKSLA